ncbi:heterokaryon incompatibility (het-6OR allele) [Fusarium acutatum]|uniref:Heterokaryon incompatibility (Het-6OR allele) n=1 Tax=Fusarium acutatum TaxID=78861 RepID=A0A8H4K5N7_9HYPO|nr:heterokaryon incompatibility (het-6OR allele) [Fusarium acutatum]
MAKITIKGNTVKIPDNLASAFLCVLSDDSFRSQSHVRYLWADAICINQNDHDEKSQQVQLMRRIFQRAHVTFAWVGPKDYSLAFEAIKTITNESIISVAKDKKPDFLPDTAWNLLSNPMSWGKLSWSFLAQARTKIPDPDGFKVLLRFLSLAGTGKYGHSDLPSWVPNYRKERKASSPWCYSASNFRSADESDPTSSPAHRACYPYVVEETQRLFSWGQDMGHITLSTNCLPDSDPEILASFMSFANSFTTRNSKYVTGIPAAQAIIRLISMDKTKKVSQDLVDNAMNLAMMITYFNMSKSQTVTKTWSSNWDHDLLNMAFSPSELAPMKVRLNVLEELSSWSLERRREAVSGIMPVLYNYRFFETSRGYLGAVDFDVLEGDRLCTLWGYKEPVVLGPDATDRYTFVGSAYAVDVDTENTIPSSRSQGQWFELR